MESVVDKFLRYVKFDTSSDEESNTVPSTLKQLKLAGQLSKELSNLKLKNVSLDKNGYVTAVLPANTEKAVPAVGFIAHMDTSPETSGKNVNPRIIEDYDGGDIVLNEQKNIVLSVKDFPEITNYRGKTLITTDGTTLLGADDKAGIAEIMAAVEYLVQHPEIKHGDIKIGFTPDEEIGRGPDHFDVKKFNAEFAYTVDGGGIGELEFENFNAASAKITVYGRNVHPGEAKGKMINSMLIAGEFMGMLPESEIPAATSGYDGFYHIVSMKGDVDRTTLNYIIRDFSQKKFEERKNFIKNCVSKINRKYDREVIKAEVTEQYKNMKEKIEPVKYIVDIASQAMRESGVEPKIVPIRGGTDGARLSFMGLPTPNIFTGGHNFHGKFEYIPTFAMEKAVQIIVKIAQITEKNYSNSF
ncbi:peptidase T [Clostridium luticellarii]|jgi:tripeptide aminopeptidase|uniref:peptidase T n=1 Tax=Clostridium luticellarii TaxID=1691940 RepID=UPI002354DECA|nr:peptidase T [Clostridium luticellarii]MCI1944240.1 peptidase T [Clostridium luticellarii]MCI1967736.1 peptidase T [Clostridium luticellarii]MCI1994614.1 peptidase T [Clostridium luticellarii]MCI2038889.1 peptidase T [Clostridium luticellarii]